MTSHRVVGLASIVLGLALSLVARGASHVPGPPLYDGVVVVEPYRWLVPSPGQVGNPMSASGSARLEGSVNPLVALATGEQPPQAQIFASPGVLVLPPGTSSIRMSIIPVQPRVLPTDGHIAGNIYRIAVTNQAGVALTAPASAKMTVVLRGPENAPDVTIEELTFAGWTPLTTESAGFGSTFLAVVTGFGDFALVAPGPGASSSSGASAATSGGSSASIAPGSGVTPPLSGQPSSPSGEQGGQGGLPIATIAGLLAIIILGAIGLAGLRQRDRRPRRNAGARRRRQ